MIFFASKFCPIDPIMLILCINHDCWAVVSCAKFWHDVFIMIHIRAMLTFRRLWLWAHNLFVKWDPGIFIAWWLIMEGNYIWTPKRLLGLKRWSNFSVEKSNELTDQQDIFCYIVAHRFRCWVVAYSAPNHNLKQYWGITNLSPSNRLQLL